MVISCRNQRASATLSFDRLVRAVHQQIRLRGRFHRRRSAIWTSRRGKSATNAWEDGTHSELYGQKAGR